MSLGYDDAVKETTNTTGAVPFGLAGAVAGFFTFMSVLGNGAQVYYVAFDPVNNAREVGYGTVTAGSPPTLSRDKILRSTNGGNAVSFLASPIVWCDFPAYVAALANASAALNLASNAGAL